MSRGSQIALGITFLVCAIGFTFMTPTLAKDAPVGLLGFLVLDVFLWIVAAACLFRRGRFITMRVTAAGVALFCGMVVVSAIQQGEFLDDLAYLWAGAGVGAAAYAITGKYPRWLPLAELFAGPSVPPAKSIDPLPEQYRRT